MSEGFGFYRRKIYKAAKTVPIVIDNFSNFIVERFTKRLKLTPSGFNATGDFIVERFTKRLELPPWGMNKNAWNLRSKDALALC